MTITSIISADLRARASFLAYCPLCSFLGHPEIPDILKGPSHRTKTLRATADQPERTKHCLIACCKLSRTDEVFDSPADAAIWWRARRLETRKDPATDSRRRGCLAKLRNAGWRPSNDRQYD